MNEDFYRERASEKFATSDNPENDAVISKAVAALSLSSGDRILDFGCADGYFLKRICEKVPGVEGYGVDIIPHSAWSDLHGLKLQGTGLPLTFPDNFFDALFCSQVLEHLNDPELAVSEFARVVRPGGRAWIAVPNGYSDTWSGFHGLQKHIDVIEGHIRHFTAAELAELFDRYGFTAVAQRYDLFVGLYLYYRYVAYNPALKRRLVASIAPSMQ
ncbi:MAG: class I SAM-dependent methyltransferase, partial [Candidatus Eremiobacteraeota bacterium]|nr:class I SAM-dependent methyltransferase [Candidatus Eremiobacteraeota bacterium]